MIAQTQLIRTHSPVDRSGGITYFVQDEQAYKNSDRLDPPCLLARGGADCSIGEAQCGRDVIFTNVTFMDEHFRPHLSPWPNTQPSSTRNAIHQLWNLMRMAPHESFIVGKERKATSLKDQDTATDSPAGLVPLSKSYGFFAWIQWFQADCWLDQPCRILRIFLLALAVSLTTIPSAPLSVMWGSCSDTSSWQVASTPGDTCKVIFLDNQRQSSKIVRLHLLKF